MLRFDYCPDLEDEEGHVHDNGQDPCDGFVES